MSSETMLLDAIRLDNDKRSANAREWVGGLYFLLACGMVTFCCIVALTQTYVISMASCNKYIHGLSDVRANTTFFIIFNIVFYFMVTVFGGMTGWIVSSSMLGLWWLILLVVGLARRIKHRRETKAALKKAAEDDDVAAKNIASGVFDPDQDALAAGGGGGYGSGSDLGGSGRKTQPLGSWSGMRDSAAFGSNEESTADFGKFESRGVLSGAESGNIQSKEEIEKEEDKNKDSSNNQQQSTSHLGAGGFGGMDTSMNVSQESPVASVEGSEAGDGSHHSGDDDNNTGASPGADDDDGGGKKKKKKLTIDTTGAEPQESSLKESAKEKKKKNRRKSGVMFSPMVLDDDNDPEGSPSGKSAGYAADDKSPFNMSTGTSLKRRSTIGGSFFGLERKGSRVFDAQAFARRNMAKKDDWTTSPEAMAPVQRTLALITVIFFILILVIMWILLLSWKVDDYHYLGTQGTSTQEIVPIETAQALQFMYAFPRIATRFQLDVYVKWFTEYCHDRFTKSLSGSEKEEEIYQNWVLSFGVNMSQFVEPNWQNYDSVNAWLIREIVMSNRPAPVSVDAITSPVDGRTLIYVIQADLSIWLKGTTLTYADLLGGLPLGGTAQYYNNGAAVISRLAPQDYHRFHAPVAGTIVSITSIAGSLWSVGPDASCSENNVLLNNRVVVVIDAGIRIGNVAVIAVGATCFGSIQLQSSTGKDLTAGSYLERGEQMGFIQFGGSTVVTLFSQGRIVWDDNIIYRSRFPVETEVPLNQQLGVVRS